MELRTGTSDLQLLFQNETAGCLSGIPYGKIMMKARMRVCVYVCVGVRVLIDHRGL